MSSKASSKPPETSSSDAAKKPNLGKIRLDTSCLQGGGGGGCPAEKLLYVLFAVIGEY